MMIEELGILPKEAGSEAWKGALITFGAFIVLGGLPMIPYLASGTYNKAEKLGSIFGAAVAVFSVALFVLGAFKVKLHPYFR
jgi:hypothetical protein